MAPHSAPQLRSLIAGEWADGSGERIEDENPSRPDELVATFELAGADQVDRAIDAAARAFGGWAATSAHQRAAILGEAAALLEDRAPAYGRDLAREQGKPLAEAIAEVQRAAEVFRYHSAEASLPSGEIFDSPRPGERIWVLRRPVGPISVITPWNVPIAIPAWKIAPALAFGNTVVWKPSQVVPLLAVRLAETLEEAGLPAGVCNLVLAPASVAGALIENPAIRGCSFTGSTEVGKQLAARAATAGKKVQAEMGGKNAAVVLADADLDHAVAEVVSGAMFSTGQRCTATGRAVVASERFDEFVERVVDATARLRVGDPLDPETQLGPLSTAEQRERVLRDFAAANRDGSRVLVGGGPLGRDGGGYFVEPTICVDLAPEHPVFMEETFGPLLAVVPAQNEQEALSLANRGSYGLAAAIFTRDLDRALHATDDLEVGVLHINSQTCGADPHVPFGGVKDSGTSHREMGRAARDFFTEVRTVYVREATTVTAQP